MTYTIVQIQLTHMTCDHEGCGITFAVPETWRAERRDDHKTFYCPNGHSRWFPTGTSDLEKANKRAEEAEQRVRWANNRADRIAMERDAVEYRRRAMKGQVTKLRNRIANGVCPVQGCRRPFANVKAHIETQHPDWAHDHPEALT